MPALPWVYWLYKTAIIRYSPISPSQSCCYGRRTHLCSDTYIMVKSASLNSNILHHSGGKPVSYSEVITLLWHAYIGLIGIDGLWSFWNRNKNCVVLLCFPSFCLSISLLFFIQRLRESRHLRMPLAIETMIQVWEGYYCYKAEGWW
jgi:hypothetical protein